MSHCPGTHSRTVIHSGDLRYKDNIKEARLEIKDSFNSDLSTNYFLKRIYKGHSLKLFFQTKIQRSLLKLLQVSRYASRNRFRMHPFN